MLSKTSDMGQSWKHYDNWHVPLYSFRETADGKILGIECQTGQSRIYALKNGELTKLHNPVDEYYFYVSALEWIEPLGRIVASGFNDATTHQVEFYRSDDMGNNWTYLGALPNTSHWIRTLSADPRNPDFLVAGSGSYSYDSTSGIIYYSLDGGMTWNEPTWNGCGDGGCVGGVTALYRSKDNPDVIVASATGQYYGNDGELGPHTGGVLVSEDGGLSWKNRSQGLPFIEEIDSAYPSPFISAVVSPPCGNTLFCAVQLNGGFYRSDDLGRTWGKIADLPVILPDNYIQNWLCWLGMSQYAVTQILPLCDGSGSFVASTMNEGILLGSPAE